jgi:hypothetical protein
MPSKTAFIETIDVRLPHLPVALEGLRIAHVTDLHARRPSRHFRRAGTLLANQRLDLVVLTGDYMDKRGHIRAAADVLAQLCRALRPRLGFFGVFGNHDSADFRRLCENLGVQWLNNRVYRHDTLPLEIIGLDTGPSDHVDAASLLLDESWPPTPRTDPDRPLRLMLSHLPHTLLMASDLGVDLMLAGHTHGGQIRPWGRPLVNSMKWPLWLTTGLLRHRQTLACISRGLGVAGFAPFRLFCPPHVPLYTLRHGGLIGPGGDAVTCVRRW